MDDNHLLSKPFYDDHQDFRNSLKDGVLKWVYGEMRLTRRGTNPREIASWAP